LRDIAATLGISERRAFGIITDLTDAGYVVKARDGRRNRYEIQHHLPLPDPAVRERTIGELLELLASATPDAPGSTRPASTRPAKTTSSTKSSRRSMRTESS
jgi:hypothetical protein